jgi:hypothetical protein
MPQDIFSQFEKKKKPEETDIFSQFEVKPTTEPIKEEYSFLDRLLQTPAVLGDLASRAWEWGNKSIPGAATAGKLATIAASVQPSEFIRNLAPTYGEFTESSLTPINLGMAAVTGGEAALARAGIAGGAKLLHTAGRVGSIPFIAEGAQRIKESEDDWVQKGLGALELAGGLAGIQARPFRVRAKPNLPEPTSIMVDDIKIPPKLELKPDVTLFDAYGKPIVKDVPEQKFRFEGDRIITLPEEPSKAKIEGGVKIGADIEPLAKVLGSSLYKGDIGKVVSKELTQNSLDAVKSLGPMGKVDITLGRGKTDKWIEVLDNGPGLTRTELETVFTDLGASGKRDVESAIGGFGLAKAAPLLGGKSVDVTTVVLENGVKIKHTFSGTPEELIKGVKINSELVPPNTPTGTTVRTHLPDDSYAFAAENQIQSMIENSPAIEANINFHHSWPSSQGTEIKSLQLNKKAGKINPADFDITPLSSPDAEIEILVPKNAKYGEQSLKLQLLNQGMYQNTVTEYTKYPGIPDKILVNIKSKVPEGHTNYPFTANREELRGSVLEAVNNAIQDTIIKPAVGKRVAQLRAVYEGMPKVNIAKQSSEHLDFHVYDVGQKFTPEELSGVVTNPEFNKLSMLLSDVMNEAVIDLGLDEARKIQKLGIIFDETVHGIYIPSPGSDKAAILVNPFNHIGDRTPDGASAGILHTVLHEIAHSSIGQHDENFTIKLADIYSKYGAKRAGEVQETILNAITSPGNRQQYNEQISEILRRYKEARGRPETITDPLRGTGIGSRNKGPGGTGEVPSGSGPSGNAVRKVIKAIQNARPLRNEQEALYSAERGERVREMLKTRKGGESGFRKRLGALKGEYEKVDFESIRHKLDDNDIGELYNAIDDSIYDGTLQPFQAINASTGLAKILGEMGGQVPTKYELALLNKVFGKDFGKSITDAGFIMMPNAGPIKLTAEITNLPRALMASNDLSAPLRQGIGLIHRKEWWTSLDDMVRAWGSEKFYRATMDAIEESSEYGFSKLTGLKLTDLGDYASREEQFMSKLAEKVPGVRRSERAYLAFLNKLRFDTFNSLIRDAQRAGLQPDVNIYLAKEIADYVNNATGRGSLGSWEKSAVKLNSLLFSPRLIASRVRMLNPATYYNASPFVRKQYLKSVLGIAALGGTVLELGQLAGGTVETNPNSADFGKLRIGNVRLDPWAGFQQYMVAAHRIISGKMQSSTTNREFELGGRYGTPTRKDVASRFLESKANPTVSFVITLMQGKDFQGLPLNVQKEVASRFVPMMMQDIYELYQEDPKLLPLASLGVLGMGVQSYSPRTSGTSIMFGDVNPAQNPIIRY